MTQGRTARAVLAMIGLTGTLVAIFVFSNGRGQSGPDSSGASQESASDAAAAAAPTVDPKPALNAATTPPQNRAPALETQPPAPQPISVSQEPRALPHAPGEDPPGQTYENPGTEGDQIANATADPYPVSKAPEATPEMIAGEQRQWGDWAQSQGESQANPQ